MFCSYIAKVFIPYINAKSRSFPVILFTDGPISHLSYHLRSLNHKIQIILTCLHLNSTHIIMPMNVSVFRILIDKWGEHLNRWKIENSVVNLAIKDFVSILKSAFEERIKQFIPPNGF